MESHNCFISTHLVFISVLVMSETPNLAKKPFSFRPRYAHPLRVGFEALMKSALIGALIFSASIHLYALGMLLYSGIFLEIYLPTLIFDLLFIGGTFIFLALAGKGQKGPILEWLSYISALIIDVFLMIGQIENFDLFTRFAWYFPFNSAMLWIWMIIILLGALYLLLVFLGAIIRLISGKLRLNINLIGHNLHKFLPLLVPILMISLAYPITTWYVNEGTVKRVITLEDTNTTCVFSIWDFPLISAQVNSTQDIDLTKLTSEENRTLTAFGKMNTIFYGCPSFNTPSQINSTIAYLKLLKAFNLRICWTIWYTNASGFPGPENAENWIAQARRTLEFVITYNLSNVIGICSDSEAEANCSSNEYWQYIGLYDSFLTEVQTNASLCHPDPAIGHFETVLCYSYHGLQDLIDGDYDNVYNRKELGLPPHSWTQYHFMQYRLSRSDNTAWLHNFNIIQLKFLGANCSAPIVGLSGIEWFAEGYYNGTYDTCGKKLQQYDYDGIDGWAAMKREIFYCKAMGFYTVSVFHLNSYQCPGKIENYGFLDYYGLECMEELAREWNQPKTIEFPISALNFHLSRTGFFYPNGEFVYDLQTNLGMYILRGGLTVAVFLWSIYTIMVSLRTKALLNRKIEEKVV